MLFQIPWWALLYLAVLCAVNGAAVLEDVKAGRRRGRVWALDALSLVLIAGLIAAWFSERALDFLGLSVIPMTVFGLGWDFFRNTHSLRRAEHELETQTGYDESEKRTAAAAMAVFSALLVLPGYIAGIAVSLRVAGL